MKIRTGFVSNSSSSSFVVLGVKMDKATSEKLKKLCPPNKEEKADDGLWWERLSEELGLEVIYNEPHCLIGEPLASGDDYMEECEYDIKEIEKKAKTIQAALKGIDVPVKLLMGTRPS